MASNKATSQQRKKIELASLAENGKLGLIKAALGKTRRASLQYKLLHELALAAAHSSHWETALFVFGSYAVKTKGWEKTYKDLCSVCLHTGRMKEYAWLVKRHECDLAKAHCEIGLQAWSPSNSTHWPESHTKTLLLMLWIQHQAQGPWPCKEVMLHIFTFCGWDWFNFQENARILGPGPVELERPLPEARQTRKRRKT